MWGFLLYFLLLVPAPIWGLFDLLGFKPCWVLAGPSGLGAACDYNRAPSLHSLVGIMPHTLCNLLSFSFLKYSVKEIECGFQWAERKSQDDLPTSMWEGPLFSLITGAQLWLSLVVNIKFCKEQYCIETWNVRSIISVQLLSCVWLFVTPWTEAHQDPLSIRVRSVNQDK